MTQSPRKGRTSHVSPEDFERLFRTAPGRFLVLNPKLEIVEVTESYLEATMTKADEIIGRGVFEVFPDNPNDPSATGVAELRASLERVIKLKRTDAMPVLKYDIARPAESGGGYEERYWSPVNSPVLDQTGKLLYIIHRAEDVTALVKAQLVSQTHAERERQLEYQALQSAGEFEALNQLLRQSNAAKAHYESLLDAIGGIVWEAEADSPDEVRHTYVSALAMERTGYGRAEFNESFWRRHVHSDDLAILGRRAKASPEGGELNLEYRVVTAEGKELWFRDRVTAFRVNSHVLLRGLVLDISSFKRAEQQLLHAQKMDSLGLLAGGVAHDFNNMLGVIMGTASLVEMKLAAGDPLHMRMQTIIEASKRSAELTNRLLAFSRRQVFQPKVLNPNDVLLETDTMLRKVIPADIEVITERDPELGNVKADAGQLQQVIMNLAINARDAMPLGGRLLIASSNVRIDEPYLAAHPEMTVGEHVLLVVSDTGTGMDEATMERIFEPFFTTKGSQGTGLGLATVYGIVKQSGGHIWAYSEPGQGTMFKVFLPRVYEGVELTSIEALPAERRGSETILVAEDHDLYRKLIAEVLRDHGYEVIVAETGTEALALAKGHAGPIHLLLTDVIMPGITGFDLAREVGQAHPEAKVALMSGYMGHALSRYGTVGENVSLLQKPFGPIELLRTIRKALE
jgi:PAS domain S-box-containing protein